MPRSERDFANGELRRLVEATLTSEMTLRACAELIGAKLSSVRACAHKHGFAFKRERIIAWRAPRPYGTQALPPNAFAGR